jgi:hypothetical protein
MDSRDIAQKPRAEQSLATRSRIPKILLTLLFFVGWGTFILDICAPGAWSLLIFGSGLFLAVLLTAKPSHLLWAVTVSILSMNPVIFTWRALPVHSMEWHKIDRVEVERITGEDHFEITDPTELSQLQDFCTRGKLQSMLKSGYGYHLRVWDDNVGYSCYVHGDAFGSMPGGFAQSIFVPSKSGFMEWFEDLLAKHGHPRR